MSAVADQPPGPSGTDQALEVACQEFVELVTEHLEGALPADLERAVVAHLDLCEPCVVYLEQMRSTVAALGGIRPPALPPPARERLLEVFSGLHRPDGPDAPGGRRPIG